MSAPRPSAGIGPDATVHTSDHAARRRFILCSVQAGEHLTVVILRSPWRQPGTITRRPDRRDPRLVPPGHRAEFRRSTGSPRTCRQIHQDPRADHVLMEDHIVVGSCPATTPNMCYRCPVDRHAMDVLSTSPWHAGQPAPRDHADDVAFQRVRCGCRRLPQTSIATPYPRYSECDLPGMTSTRWSNGATNPEASRFRLVDPVDDMRD
jgi:hypothetical protein